ncbi:MAG: hypothetical protein GZ093_10455 [Rhodoferax sp.]|uniref:hypothetical protein n=1 Tax=Rhodoferax sp. TaxID=50421 RepID=UPI0013FE88CD|nr:hypothetical protein [Rhodoferax sp.]NDP39151.1 hypothetical protein [Rhodoferax sp.]
MKCRESGMPEEAYWASFFDTEAAIETLFGSTDEPGHILNLAAAMARSRWRLPGVPAGFTALSRLTCGRLVLFTFAFWPSVNPTTGEY